MRALRFEVTGESLTLKKTTTATATASQKVVNKLKELGHC